MHAARIFRARVYLRSKGMDDTTSWSKPDIGACSGFQSVVLEFGLERVALVLGIYICLNRGDPLFVGSIPYSAVFRVIVHNINLSNILTNEDGPSQSPARFQQRLFGIR